MNQKITPTEKLPDELSTSLDPLFASPAPETNQRQAITRLQQSLAEATENLMFYTHFEHQLVGQIFIMLRQGKLLSVDFGIDENKFWTRIDKLFAERPYYSPERLKTATTEICDYLDGKRITFELETDLVNLTKFQRQVLTATSQVPRGSVVTYLDIARLIGNPKAVRAVGQALGRNPIPIVIPCHRVIAANGSLGGYSGGGGLTTKARLLQLEGAILS